MQRQGAALGWAIALAACSTAAEQETTDAGASGLGTAVAADPGDGEGDGRGTDEGVGELEGDNDPGQPEDASTSEDTMDPDATGPSSAPLWMPPPGTTWQWQLTQEIDTRVDVEAYDIDLFDVGPEIFDELHAAGRVVICYFSAGSYEEWRPDADQFPGAALGDPLEDWPGERWLDHRDPTVRAIMSQRLDLAVDKGCDAVEPDNVDGYANPNGVGLTAEDQLDYNLWLAAEAHARGLSIGLKNDLDQVEALADQFDWALNEECMQFDECEVLLAPFIDAGKAVFHVEYVDSPVDGQALADAICDDANEWQFSTMVKGWDLDAWRIACWR